MDDIELEPEDTLAVEGEPKSSASVLAQLAEWDKAYRDWNDVCDEIDDIYSRRDRTSSAIALTSIDGWKDAELDLFWASYEILKPAIYAHIPWKSRRC